MATDNGPLIFLTGVTGQTGRFILEDFDRNPSGARIRVGVREQADLERLRNEGRDAVPFDLDDPRTFGPALCGVDRLNVLTGYTIATAHQTKTLVDAAGKAGVKHIVNQGVFANDDCTDRSSPGSRWSSAASKPVASPGRICTPTCSWMGC